jgi:hypothetical protein
MLDVSLGKAVTVKKFELTRTIPSGLKVLEMVMSPALLTNAPFSRAVMNLKNF